MWKLSIQDDQGQKTVVNLVRDEYTIGRSEGNSIRLTERNISRRHARVVRTSSGYRIEDSRSLLGVHVNGVRLVNHQELAHKDLIQLGDYRVEVIDEDLETQQQGHLPFSNAPPSSGRLPDRLVVLIGPNQGMEYALEGERFLLGRGEECDFCIEHASVSRVHAEVRRADPTHFEIIDKGSANGLRVNGHEMPRALLDSRDVVELGDVVLKFIPQGQAFRATAAEGQRIAALGGLATPPPPASVTAASGKSIAIAALVSAVAVGGAFIWWTQRAAEKTPIASEETQKGGEVLVTANTGSPPPAATPSAATELDEAQRLLAAGELLRAHETAQKVAAADAVRHSSQFREFESAWAKAMIASAQAASDVALRRDLLDRVVRAEAVPNDLREVAFVELRRTSEGSIDLSDLDAPPTTKKLPASSKKPSASTPK